VRRTGTRWRLAAGAGLLIGVVWVAGAAGASSGVLTLHASLRHVIYGQGVALSGLDTVQGRGIAHAPISVQANVFPFKSGFHTMASGQTDASGRYRIKVRPSHATEYRVSSQGSPATSPTVTVYVIAKDQGSCNLCTIHNSPGTHTLIVGDLDQFPPGPIAAQGPEFFYYGQRNGSQALPATIQLIKTVPLHRLKGNRLQDNVHYVVHFPAGQPFHFTFATCFRDAEALDGVGLPGHHHCGDPVLTRAEFLGYLG
jgi:hypothetical protein